VPRLARRGGVPLRTLLLKRAFDIVAASMLILVVLPLLVGVSLAILLDGGGPILYRQERVTGRARRRDGRVVWVPRRFRIL
jgi:lipopolysaccharide/colanic/teichoic acid biosynthesis glycosyltransferase